MKPKGDRPHNLYRFDSVDDITPGVIKNIVRQLRNGLHINIIVPGHSASEGFGMFVEDRVMGALQSQVNRDYLRSYHLERVHFRIGG